MEIRALRPDDDRSAFRSGDPDLDRHFHRYAGQNQFRHYIGTSYIAVEDEASFGFATVSPGIIESDDLAPALRKKLPRYPYPILRLARLAVAEGAQGKGIGKQLLRFVFHLALRMADEYGCIGVVVDAKPGAISFYSAHGFEPQEVLQGASDARPQPVAMFISCKDLRSASR